MFALDLMFWCVTGFTLLTLACSTVFVICFIVSKLFEILVAILFLESRVTGQAGMLPNAKMMVAVVDKNFGAVRRGIEALNAATTAGPWGPIDRGLSPEMARKIERVMAVGVGMRDAAGNLCPHPIAPRVALAIVEALQAHQ
jgi:hypothetical protein